MDAARDLARDELDQLINANGEMTLDQARALLGSSHDSEHLATIPPAYVTARKDGDGLVAALGLRYIRALLFTGKLRRAPSR